MAIRFTAVFLLALLCAGSALAQDYILPPRLGTITIDDNHLVNRSVIRVGGISALTNVAARGPNGESGIGRNIGSSECQGVTTVEPTYVLYLYGTEWDTLHINVTPNRVSPEASLHRNEDYRLSVFRDRSEPDHMNYWGRSYPSGLLVRGADGQFSCSWQENGRGEWEWDPNQGLRIPNARSGVYYIWVTTPDEPRVRELAERAQYWRSMGYQTMDDVPRWQRDRAFSGISLASDSKVLMVEVAVNIRAYSSTRALTLEMLPQPNQWLPRRMHQRVIITPREGWIRHYSMDDFQP